MRIPKRREVMILSLEELLETEKPVPVKAEPHSLTLSFSRHTDQTAQDLITFNKIFLENNLYKESYHPENEEHLQDLEFVKNLLKTIDEDDSRNVIESLLENQSDFVEEKVKVEYSLFKTYLSNSHYYNVVMDNLANYKLLVLRKFEETKNDFYKHLLNEVETLTQRVEAVWNWFLNHVTINMGNVEVKLSDYLQDKEDTVSNELQKSLKKVEELKTTLESNNLSNESLDAYQDYIRVLNKRHRLNIQGNYKDPFGTMEYNKQVTTNLVNDCIGLIKTKQRLI